MQGHQQFWQWFTDRESELFTFDSSNEVARELLFDELSAALAAIDSHLTFEFGPRQNGCREFVLSAGGRKESFPSVQSLIAAAPILKRWRWTAFRPRRPFDHYVTIDDVKVDPDRVYFSLIPEGELVGIQLFIPGFSAENVAMRQIGYLLLDGALGEYDVETRVGGIEMLPYLESSSDDQFPLTDLPRMFDGLFFERQTNGDLDGK